MSPTILAFDVGGTAIKHCLIQDGVCRTVFEEPTLANRGGQAILASLFRIADSRSGFDAIAVSTAGQVDRGDGTILFANENLPDYTGTHLKASLATRYGMPVIVENDVNCAALGEHRFGAGQAYDNYLCLTYGTGIGGAIIIDGKLYRGAHFAAGEFGHFILHPDGLPCVCGNRGCYEQYASVSALVKNASCFEKQLGHMDGRAIFEHLGTSEMLKGIVDAWIGEMTKGLANLVTVFDPECLILGGGIMNEPYIISEVRTHIDSSLMHPMQGIPILPARLGNTAGLLGAYALCMDELQESR